ncbi:MAG: MgtC/SapB family protein [Leptolyngbyaceae bacterium]|nr:MgtC/SapB family protein [Leptolyngbyaceae bacterium]
MVVTVPFPVLSALMTSSESPEVLLRLVLAVIVGSIIGWNRQRAGKPAGLRTHMLVSLGAALIVLIPLQTSPTNSTEALSRAIQGVATGIGFLGAGEILHQSRRNSHKLEVQGLTSAAAIWVTAALGMAIGCGLWLTTLTGALLAWLILKFVKNLEKTIFIQSDQD